VKQRAVASSQPSSLILRGAGQPRCGACGSERVTTLAMTLTDGTPVTFVSCHACEQRSWTTPTGELELPDVLARSAKRTA
jgi:hypothetical protein